jgi:HSP20 family protein
MAQSRTENQQQVPPAEANRNAAVATRRRGADLPAGPFDLMRRMTQQMFGSFDIADEMFVPQIEMFQRDGKFIVRADLPGMNKDDVRVEVRDRSVMISGERREERKDRRDGYTVSERRYGTFYRVVPLPEGVDPDKLDAVFREGVLELSMDAPRQDREGTTIPIRESHETNPQSDRGET